MTLDLVAAKSYLTFPSPRWPQSFSRRSTRHRTITRADKRSRLEGAARQAAEGFLVSEQVFEEKGDPVVEFEETQNAAADPADGKNRSIEAGPRGSVSFSEIEASFPFELDDFQKEAIKEILTGKSVVVCAPTGAGKTAIAQAAAVYCLASGKKMIYTTPLKALSNQKHYEFRQKFGADMSGLVTGDACVQKYSPIIVMTTEILRNIFYEVEVEGLGLYSEKSLDEIGLVVLDEVHYLGDPGRGSVWEELIVGCPRHVQMLCMSATVANPRDLGDWISQIHGPCSTVETTERPVPLSWFFGFSDPKTERTPIVPLFNSDKTAVNKKCIYKHSSGFLEEEDLDFVNPASRVPIMHKLVGEMDRRDFLPAIFFIFSRLDCDRQAVDLHDKGASLTSCSEQKTIREALEKLKRDQPEAVKGNCMDPLINGIATHHAGCLPAWKLLVESLFQAGLLKVVFATGTLAAGINMPARSTVVTSLARKIDGEITPLRHNDLLQMAGRAGRRGFDTRGNCVVLQSKFEGAADAVAILRKGTEPLISQFTTGYSFVLNLLSKFTLDEAKTFLERSFRSYQTGIGLVRRMEQIAELVEARRALRLEADKAGSDSSAEGQSLYAELKQEHRKAARALRRLMSEAREERARAARVLLKNIGFPFPVLIDVTKNALGTEAVPAVAFGIEENEDIERLVVLTADNSFYRITYESVVGVIDRRFEAFSGLETALEAVLSSKTRWKPAKAADTLACKGSKQTARAAFKIPLASQYDRISWSQGTETKIEELTFRTKHLKREMKYADPGESGSSVKLRTRMKANDAELKTATRIKRELENQRQASWNGFARTMEILIEVGALERDSLQILPLGSVTREFFGENELWMAMVFTHASVQMLKPSILAALASTMVAPAICTRPGLHVQIRPPEEILELLEELDEQRSLIYEYEVTSETVNQQALFGLQMDCRASGIVEAWAAGCDWKHLVKSTNMDDGDVARLLQRTQDVLRQVARSNHLLDPLKSSAKKAQRSMDRRPIKSEI